MRTQGCCLQMVRKVYSFEEKAEDSIVRLGSSPGLEALEGDAPLATLSEWKATV
jgi:hypothetical protein